MFTDFEFADKRLSDFGWIVGHIGDSSGVSEADIGCDITFNTVKNNHSSIHYKTSTSYENVYVPQTFDIFKNPCGKNQEEMYVTNDEIRDLMKWLNRHEYRKFKPLYHFDFSDIYYYGKFNVKKKTIGDRVVGLVLTFTANAPYGFGEKIIHEYNIEVIEDFKNTFAVYLDSDEFGRIYPNVSITCKAVGDLTIANKFTKTSTTIKNCSIGENIYINGEHKIITTDNEAHRSTLYNDFNYNYLDILLDEYDDTNENEYEVSLPCTIKIEYSPIRKVGV